MRLLDEQARRELIDRAMELSGAGWSDRRVMWFVFRETFKRTILSDLGMWAAIAGAACGLAMARIIMAVCR